jgi:hypothetical protein
MEFFLLFFGVVVDFCAWPQVRGTSTQRPNAKISLPSSAERSWVKGETE